MCGKTMFKKAGRGFNKPFCANPECANFLPEDQRGYRRRKPAEGEAAESGAAAPAEEKKPAAKKTAAKKTTVKKPAAKKTAAKKPAVRKAAKKSEEA